MFDYEFAVTPAPHRLPAGQAGDDPRPVPPERLRRYGVGPEKLFQYPGLKEEYYLSDFEPDAEALRAARASTRQRVVVIVRPPPDVSLYHRKSNPLFPQVLDRLGSDEGVHAVVLPRTEAQRAFIQSLALPSVIVPAGAVDAQSLVALADLVVSAGGTMNREAVALGTPVYTTYGGRLGGVDEALIRSGRLRPLTDPRALELEKRSGDGRADAARSRTARRDRSWERSGPQPLRGEPHQTTPSTGTPSSRGRAWRSCIAPRGRGRSPRGRRRAARARPDDRRLRAGRALAAAGADRRWRSRSTPGRPVLYRGARVGRAGRLFSMYKFRTLQPRCRDRLGPYLGEELSRRTEDEVTRVGGVLRATHLDEMPQLWNVLRGDMSDRRPAPDPARLLRGALRARSPSTGSGWWCGPG